MSCDLWAGMLDAYADDSCSPEERAGIEEHLRTCPACASAVLARVQAKRMNRSAAMRLIWGAGAPRMDAEGSGHERLAV